MEAPERPASADPVQPASADPVQPASADPVRQDRRKMDHRAGPGILQARAARKVPKVARAVMAAATVAWMDRQAVVAPWTPDPVCACPAPSSARARARRHNSVIHPETGAISRLVSTAAPTAAVRARAYRGASVARRTTASRPVRHRGFGLVPPRAPIRRASMERVSAPARPARRGAAPTAILR